MPWPLGRKVSGALNLLRTCSLGAGMRSRKRRPYLKPTAFMTAKEWQSVIAVHIQQSLDKEFKRRIKRVGAEHGR